MSSVFHNAGISDDADPGAANLDGGGRSLSAPTPADAGLTAGATVEHDRLTFTWPDTAPGSHDNVRADGQQITVDGSGSKLGFLATSTNGPSSGTGTITYTDGTTQNYTLAVADWTTNTPATGTDTLATLPRRNTSTGGITDHPVSIYASTIPLQDGKTVAHLTLPDARSRMHIFASTIG
ncbi:hypothetical protein ACFU8W_50935 [Streptomyces sp. NPDC057565]|uniref:hypothetical protein n=1 Tax=Streptomyces sp. NPDC057565 TaxID=3346169 RepID=UPI00369612B3